MTFSTLPKLKAMIGTSTAVNSIDDGDLTIMLELSYNEIVARLQSEDVPVPDSDGRLDSAELNLTMNRVVTRGKIDGTLTDGQGSAGDYAVYDVDSSIYILYQRGWELVDLYIKDKQRTAIVPRKMFKVNR